MLPHPIVIQGFKQLLRVALRDAGNDLDETTEQPDVRWGRPGHHRPGHVLRSSVPYGDELLVLGLGRAHPPESPSARSAGATAFHSPIAVRDEETLRQALACVR